MKKAIGRQLSAGRPSRFCNTSFVCGPEARRFLRSVIRQPVVGVLTCWQGPIWQNSWGFAQFHFQKPL